jgi:hypothetical protein
MKRILAFIFCISIVLSLAGCRTDPASAGQSFTPPLNSGEICGAPEAKY